MLISSNPRLVTIENKLDTCAFDFETKLWWMENIQFKYENFRGMLNQYKK